MFYPTREEAEVDVRLIFEREHIQIDAPSGHKLAVKGFQVEERNPGEFVVFCEWPLSAPHGA
jgi:hypothetical protein